MEDTRFVPFRKPVTARIPFPHLTLNAFSKAFRDFIHFGVYSDFKAYIFASYQKAIQAFLQEKLHPGKMSDYAPPIFNYDITIDESPQPTEYLWRSSTATVGIAKRLYPPFYSDDEMSLHLINRRVKGTVNMNIFCSSLPELFDIRQAFLDAFWGMNCFRRAEIRAYTVIPDSFLLQDIHGKSVVKNINEQHLCRSFVRAINSNRYYFLSNTSVLINLTGLNQNSNNYGGVNLSEHTLTGTCTFEIELPQYVMAHTRKYEKIIIDVGVDFDFRNKDVLGLVSKYVGNPVSYDNDDIMKFENGNIHYWLGYTVPDNNISIIDLDDVIPKPRTYEINQKDKQLLLIFSGGLVICEEPGVNITDGHILDFSPIKFMKDELIEFIVFEPNSGGITK